MASLAAISGHLDDFLRTADIPDYGGALNGLQVQNRGEVRKVAAAVDLSRRTIAGAARDGADLLLVHHGAFWGGAQPIRGPQYERLRLLFEHDIAVYSSHLPLDLHADLGNNVLLARELDLRPTGGFARHEAIMIGVRGESDLETEVLAARVAEFARAHGSAVRTTPLDGGRRTRRWAICTGAGASSETIREAAAADIDTLIVGEGPHHTAVEAPEAGIVIIYAGHYATETLGVRALAEHTAARFDVPWTFIDAPTGL
ncbi:MAG TPA: Nif3-like dinuclear metal center hexameric protein [Gemmatimonadaceae bacterium]|nr:Nif3-like dinuclear metal center hexameric protein [Gemmatimonadaceae bacterium]